MYCIMSKEKKDMFVKKTPLVPGAVLLKYAELFCYHLILKD